MGTEILSALQSPFWRHMLMVAAAMVLLLVGTIGFKFAIAFDINAWLSARREAKALKVKMKNARRCGHLWTLYHASPYSKCNLCSAYVATTTLLMLSADPKIRIAGENWNLQIHIRTAGALVHDPAGTRRKLSKLTRSADGSPSR